jgi:hypothetical protein
VRQKIVDMVLMAGFAVGFFAAAFTLGQPRFDWAVLALGAAVTAGMIANHWNDEPEALWSERL